MLASALFSGPILLVACVALFAAQYLLPEPVVQLEIEPQGWLLWPNRPTPRDRPVPCIDRVLTQSQ